MSDQRPAMNNHANLIWSLAELLRGDYKQSEYGRVILPLVVLRRLDCVLEPTKAQVLKRLDSAKVENVGVILGAITGLGVYNTSRLTLRTILADPAQVAGNLRAWIACFDADTRDVIEKFDFDAQIGRLDRAKILYLVLSKVTEVDLHPDAVSNTEMGYLYEELIRKFSELSNETAGEHFTPREVIRLMVDLLFLEDDEALRTPGIVRTLLDPACGTGGMLSVAADHLRALNPGAHLEAYGQELNAETYAICRSDMVLKGQKASNIRLGNSFSEDQFRGERFDYCLANPPFGVEWITVERPLRLRYAVPEDFKTAAMAAPGWSKLTVDIDHPTLLMALDRLSGVSTTDPDDVERATERIEPFSNAARKVMWQVIARTDPYAPAVTDRNGNPEPDSDLRDNENVPLPGPVDGFDSDPTERLASDPYLDAVDAYMTAEVHPYVPDAWVDHAKTRIGYEIPLTRQFYRYVPPRPLAEIDAEIKALEEQIQRLLREVTA